MERCQQIKAFHQREERYQGLELVYDGSNSLKDQITDLIDDVTLETGMTPKLCEYSRGSIYIEFHDDYDRDGGNYFTRLLGKLGIAQCEAG